MNERVNPDYRHSVRMRWLKMAQQHVTCCSSFMFFARTQHITVYIKYAPFFKRCVSSGRESNFRTPLHISFSTRSPSISCGLGSLSTTMSSRDWERGSHWSKMALRQTRGSEWRPSRADIFRFKDLTICSVLILSLQ